MLEDYTSIQHTLRTLSREYARNHPSWFRNPQNNGQLLTSYFKPRVNILVRPPFNKTGNIRTLTVGSGEVVFHLHGPIISGTFKPDEHYRIIVGSHSPSGLLEMIEQKLEVAEPSISVGFEVKEYDRSVRELYGIVRDSIICLRTID